MTVVGLVWLKDPESYAGGSVAIGRASHARQVDDDPDKKRHPGPLGCGLGVGLTTPPCITYVMKFQLKPQNGNKRL